MGTARIAEAAHARKASQTVSSALAGQPGLASVAAIESLRQNLLPKEACMPFGSRLLAEQLRSLARERIKANQLPVAFSERVFAGYGSDTSICALCRERITPEQVEYEVDDPRLGKHFSLHLVCHAAWGLECASEAKGGSSTP